MKTDIAMSPRSWMFESWSSWWFILHSGAQFRADSCSLKNDKVVVFERTFDGLQYMKAELPIKSINLCFPLHKGSVFPEFCGWQVAPGEP